MDVTMEKGNDKNNNQESVRAIWSDTPLDTLFQILLAPLVEIIVDVLVISYGCRS
jgi:hypothetical protein